MKWALARLIIFLKIGLLTSRIWASEPFFGDSLPDDDLSLSLNSPHLMINTTGEGVDLSLALPSAFDFSEQAALSTLISRTQLKSKLEQGSTLFSFNDAAECKLVSAQAYSDYFDDRLPSSTTHNSALDVSWSFDCAKPEALHLLQTHLFAAFPQALSELVLEWVSSTKDERLKVYTDTLIPLD